MRFDEMKSRVRNLPVVASWPGMLAMVERVGHKEGVSVWEHPVSACRAVGGREEAALPAAAAVFCSLISIHLVDDMLDHEPLGDFRRLGEGRTANLALAFQAAGHLVLAEAEAPAAVQTALQTSFARMSLATCFGQELDARELTSEAEYWRVVGTKTPPLFGEALRMGALLGGATADLAEQLAEVGRVLGRFIQVSDDITDALEVPARADWQRRSNNLPLLFAMTAGHADRDEFLRLSARAGEPDALAAAQKILFRCGAVSYCTLKLIELAREARELFARIRLQNPEPIEQLLEVHTRPLYRLLEIVGVQDPAALAMA
ncbi:MAG TPA: polyprenyl synthetase family protein [Thermoanaerobaculia bacterium]|nr:polyprenyl synthetase family protein [Thermoanaerobaculia bacterium]